MTTMTKPRFKRTPYAASIRPKELYSYYVSGRGEFPWDMLRYDAAWPVSSADAVKMTQRVRVPSRITEGVLTEGVRSIEMYSWSEPTIDRWSSFGWSVGLENLTERSIG